MEPHAEAASIDRLVSVASCSPARLLQRRRPRRTLSPSSARRSTPCVGGVPASGCATHQGARARRGRGRDRAGHLRRRPSGRNGGFALTWWSKVSTLIKRVGVEEAIRLAKVSEDAARRSAPSASVRAWTRTSTAAAGSGLPPHRPRWGVGGERRDRRRARRSPIRASERGTGAGAHGLADPPRGGLREDRGHRPAGASRPWPAQGRRRAGRPHLRAHADGRARPRGRRGAHSVRTRERRRHHPRAERLGDEDPRARHAASAVSSDMVATAPMPETLRKVAGRAAAISDCRLLVHYYRPTKDGRVAFGRGGGRLAFGGRVNSNFDYNGRQTRELEEELVTLVPAAKDVPVHTRGEDRSTARPTAFPSSARSPPVRTSSTARGYSGNGVAPSLTVAKMLASSALAATMNGRLAVQLRRLRAFPPEPLRFVGGLVVRQAVRHKEGREDQAKSVDPVTKAVAGLAPQGFSAPGAEVAKSRAAGRFLRLSPRRCTRGNRGARPGLRTASGSSSPIRIRTTVCRLRGGSVEIALCHGWIDGQVKRLVLQHYLQRFSPRRAASKWSKLNRNKADRLIAEGRAPGRPARFGARSLRTVGWERGLRLCYDGSRGAARRPQRWTPSRPPRTSSSSLGNTSATRSSTVSVDAKRPDTRVKRIAQYLELLRARKTPDPRADYSRCRRSGLSHCMPGPRPARAGWLGLGSPPAAAKRAPTRNVAWSPPFTTSI